MSLIFLTIFILCVFVAFYYMCKQIGYSNYIIEWDFTEEKYFVVHTTWFGIAKRPLLNSGVISYFASVGDARDYIEKIRPVTI